MNVLDEGSNDYKFITSFYVHILLPIYNKCQAFKGINIIVQDKLFVLFPCVILDKNSYFYIILKLTNTYPVVDDNCTIVLVVLDRHVSYVYGIKFQK
jgi:hypothetical protein